MSFIPPPRGVSKQPLQSPQQSTQPPQETPQEKENDWIGGIFSAWNQKPDQKNLNERLNTPGSPPSDEVIHQPATSPISGFFSISTPASPKQETKRRSGFFQDQKEAKQLNSPPQKFSSISRKFSLVPHQSTSENLKSNAVDQPTPPQSQGSIRRIFTKKSTPFENSTLLAGPNETVAQPLSDDAISEPASPQTHTSIQSVSQSTLSQYNSDMSQETYENYIPMETSQSSQTLAPANMRRKTTKASYQSTIEVQSQQNSVETTNQDTKFNVKENHDLPVSEQIYIEVKHQESESQVVEQENHENSPLDTDINSLEIIESMEYSLPKESSTLQVQLSGKAEEIPEHQPNLSTQSPNFQQEVENYQDYYTQQYSQTSHAIQENPVVTEHTSNEIKDMFPNGKLPLARGYSYDNMHEEPSPMIPSQHEPIITPVTVIEKLPSSKPSEIQRISPTFSLNSPNDLTEIPVFPEIVSLPPETEPNKNTSIVDSSNEFKKPTKITPVIPPRGDSIEKVDTIFPDFPVTIPKFPVVTEDPFADKYIDTHQHQYDRLDIFEKPQIEIPSGRRPPKPVGERPSKPQINIQNYPADQEKSLEELHRESKERVMLLREKRKEVQDCNENLQKDISREEQEINEILQTLGMNPLTFSMPLNELEECMNEITENAEATTQQWEKAARDYYPFVKNEISLLINGVAENSDEKNSDAMYENLNFDAVEHAMHQLNTEMERVSSELANKAAIVQIRGKLIKNLQSQMTSESTDRIINERTAEYQTSDWERRLPGHVIFRKMRDETELEAHQIAAKLELMKSSGTAIEQELEVLQKEYDQMLKMKKKLVKRRKKLVKDVEPLLEGSVKAITMVFGMVLKEHQELTEAKNVLDNFHKEQELLQQFDNYQ
ncbi:hypothetical protein HK096_004483 [Nowakowskiella sp. JEL0078]|nr:hypothetical protein HK096_004483 [Nowakowskiella sp. JEL0078]